MNQITIIINIIIALKFDSQVLQDLYLRFQ